MTKDWSDQDVDLFIETLKADNPEFWNKYMRTETRWDNISKDAGRWMDSVARRLFPDSGYAEVTHLILRLRSTVWKQSKSD